jgi:hypothetical protein
LRIQYIKALEQADYGDLAQLTSIFARLERNAIMLALSVDADSEISAQRSLTSAVIENLAHKFSKRREQKDAQLRIVNVLAKALRGRARRQLEHAYNELAKSMSEIVEPQINMADGGPDRNNAHWYKYEVFQSANASGVSERISDDGRREETRKFVNFSEEHYFVKASLKVDRERLVFVSSFHHVGRELSGIMEATAFAKLESTEESEDREIVSEEFFLCSLEPFVFTYKTKEAEIVEAFTHWLDAAIAVAIKEFGDRL